MTNANFQNRSELEALVNATLKKVSVFLKEQQRAQRRLFFLSVAFMLSGISILPVVRLIREASGQSTIGWQKPGLSVLAGLLFCGGLMIVWFRYHFSGKRDHSQECMNQLRELAGTLDEPQTTDTEAAAKYQTICCEYSEVVEPNPAADFLKVLGKEIPWWAASSMMFVLSAGMFCWQWPLAQEALKNHVKHPYTGLSVSLIWFLMGIDHLPGLPKWIKSLMWMVVMVLGVLVFLS